MSDYSDLKSIAEACQQHQPLRFMRSHGALYIRNDNGIVFDVRQNQRFPEIMAANKDYADLVLAASPATVLALIAENERLESWSVSEGHLLKASNARLHEVAVACATAEQERDHLKAENEALRKDADRFRRMRAMTLAQIDDTQDEFDAEFDRQLDAAMSKESSNG